MTKADKIRALEGLPTKRVATILGCDPQDVHNLRSRDKHRAKFRETQRIGAERRRRAKGVKPQPRFDANPFWASRDAKVVEMIKAGRLTREVAEAVGATKNAVIGRWNRLKQAGLA